MEKSVQVVRIGPQPAKPRLAWKPLGYEKLSMAEAKTGSSGHGLDNLVYS